MSILWFIKCHGPFFMSTYNCNYLLGLCQPGATKSNLTLEGPGNPPWFSAKMYRLSMIRFFFIWIPSLIVQVIFEKVLGSMGSVLDYHLLAALFAYYFVYRSRYWVPISVCPMCQALYLWVLTNRMPLVEHLNPSDLQAFYFHWEQMSSGYLQFSEAIILRMWGN